MKHGFSLLVALLLAPQVAAIEPAPNRDIALQPAHVIIAPWRQHVPATKRQGVPGIERTAKGRLWVVYGRDVESTRTFQIVRGSDDDGVSHDGGKTWSEVERSSIRHPTSRFFVRRLNSGALLLVKHGPLDERTRREKLMAFISDDEGKTWQGGLMLDEREGVTYPDGVQASDGTLYIIYDHQRTPLGEVLMATFTEQDVRAGKPVSERAQLRQLVDRLTT